MVINDDGNVYAMCAQKSAAIAPHVDYKINREEVHAGAAKKES